MKVRFILPLCILLGACAGNPPEWWNPSGAHAAKTEQAAAAPAASSARAPQTGDDLMLVEQNIDTVDDDYEEMDLTEKSAPVQEQTAQAADKSQAATPAAKQEHIIPTVEENLPQDGSLPPPSVLQ